jgi:Protein of unknown function (DUF2742)
VTHGKGARPGPLTENSQHGVYQPPRDFPITVCVSAQQVSWFDVHEFVVDHLDVESWPMAGTPEWCRLDHDDPAKIAAVLDGGRHWALRVETCQEARCAAACEVSAAADWRQIAQQIRLHSEFYAQHAWLRRRPS